MSIAGAITLRSTDAFISLTLGVFSILCFIIGFYFHLVYLHGIGDLASLFAFIWGGYYLHRAQEIRSIPNIDIISGFYEGTAKMGLALGIVGIILNSLWIMYF